ncbi:unnamed protein product [Brassica rapa]|uniref:Major facilitator superfamily (MFS) profile domain-containing protein n=1 Tax=Brassica campestris TaxID=3711 RepID=A0A3P5YTR2_BRACM|nr:unnamed protein product [Brassica rapa]VDC66595.1 unnamed protein product [Brassica rapa]
MCYSLSLQSSIDFRNRSSIKIIHGDRAIFTSNLKFPALAKRDRRGRLLLCRGRGVGSLRFRGDTAVDLCGLPRHRLRVDCSDARRTPQDTAASEQPSFSEFITSERVKVVAMLALALALCNADRVVMSVAIVPLSLSRGWSKSFSGIVQSSFLWGYLISPIAGGTLVDRYGGKVIMAWGVALWSLATFLTPWAADTSLWALLAARAMVGVAEGVALPCMNNMVAR